MRRDGENADGDIEVDEFVEEPGVIDIDPLPIYLETLRKRRAEMREDMIQFMKRDFDRAEEVLSQPKPEIGDVISIADRMVEWAEWMAVHASGEKRKKLEEALAWWRRLREANVERAKRILQSHEGAEGNE